LRGCHKRRSLAALHPYAMALGMRPEWASRTASTSLSPWIT
jgi:hypothetical protein